MTCPRCGKEMSCVAPHAFYCSCGRIVEDYSGRMEYEDRLRKEQEAEAERNRWNYYNDYDDSSSSSYSSYSSSSSYSSPSSYHYSSYGKKSIFTRIAEDFKNLVRAIIFFAIIYIIVSIFNS